MPGKDVWASERCACVRDVYRICVGEGTVERKSARLRMCGDGVRATRKRAVHDVLFGMRREPAWETGVRCDSTGCVWMCKVVVWVWVCVETAWERNRTCVGEGVVEGARHNVQQRPKLQVRLPAQASSQALGQTASTSLESPTVGACRSNDLRQGHSVWGKQGHGRGIAYGDLTRADLR